MYTHIWKKYLPVIKILLKRAKEEEQVLNLNKIDFEKAMMVKKSGLKFNIVFHNGKVENVISASPLAVNLAQLLLEEDDTREIVENDDFELKMSNKLQLTVKVLERDS